MDEACYVNCPSMKTQSIEAMNACSVANKVDEDIGDSNCESQNILDMLAYDANFMCLGISALPGVPMSKAKA